MSESKSEETMRNLVKRAREAAGAAYAPYSDFHVGAALTMLDDPKGEIFTGCNVENASYGATNCAERVAIGSAIAKGFRKIHLLAISLPGVQENSELADRSPCGICRQVIHEFSVESETLVLIDKGGAEFDYDLIEPAVLLPFGFRL